MKYNKWLKFKLNNFYNNLKFSFKLITSVIHIEHLHSTVQNAICLILKKTK